MKQARTGIGGGVGGSLGILVVATFALSSAFAADPKDEARARYVEAQNHYNLNEFREALAAYKDAYRLFPDPAFLYNIGQCQRQLGDLDEAIRFYRSYLRNKPGALNRLEVERKIEELKTLIEAKKTATQSPPLATIPPAGRDEKPSTAPPAFSTPSKTVTSPPPPQPPPPPLEGSSTSNVLSLSSPPAEPTDGPASVDLVATAPEREPKPLYKTWWVWAAAGGVVAAILVGVAVASSGGSSGPPQSGLGNTKAF